MRQRTETIECENFLGHASYFGYLGLISDPLIVSKFHNETHKFSLKLHSL